jgi:hypothetical protein
LPSCKKSTQKISIDLQSGFRNDKVRVFVDGEEYMNSYFTTREHLGVAGGSEEKIIQSGKHELKIIINESIIQTEAFTVKSDLYIGISYFKDSGRINFNYSSQPFFYD